MGRNRRLTSPPADAVGADKLGPEAEHPLAVGLALHSYCLDQHKRVGVERQRSSVRVFAVCVTASRISGEPLPRFTNSIAESIVIWPSTTARIWHGRSPAAGSQMCLRRLCGSRSRVFWVLTSDARCL